MTANDPTRKLKGRTPEELSVFVDDHVILALVAADLLHGDRDLAEDFVRDRLVAMSDTYGTPSQLSLEERRRTMKRLGAVLGLRDA